MSLEALKTKLTLIGTVVSTVVAIVAVVVGIAVQRAELRYEVHAAEKERGGLSRRLAESEAKHHEHVSSPGHPVTGVTVRALEGRLDRLEGKIDELIQISRGR